MSSDINYTKEAFLNPWNLVFLIVAMVTTLFVIGITPLSTVVPLFALAAELLYLGIVPRQERFRRAIRAREAAEHSKPPSERELLRLLGKQSQKRYIWLRQLEDKIKENYRKVGYASQGLLDAHVKKLDGLLDSYLNLLHARERYEQFARSTSERQVAQAMQQIRQEIEEDPPKVQAIKRRRLDILERRLQKFKKTNENLDVIEAQLETIEDVTRYIHEQSLTMSNPEEITFQLDTLLMEVEATQAAVDEVEDMFVAPTSAGLLDDMDTYTPGREDERSSGRSRMKE
ncbi:MAG: hypothetical protein AAGI08_15970 [Bacteroidota bacterium]